MALKRVINQNKMRTIRRNRITERMLTRPMRNRKRMLIRPRFLKKAKMSVGFAGALKLKATMRLMSSILSLPLVNAPAQWVKSTYNVSEDG